MLVLVSVRETRSWGGPLQEGDSPSKGGPRGSPSRGYFSLCITIYMRKNHNCKKRQWCLVHVMCPLSMHQFIETSISALENKINSNISMSSDPWKSVRPTGLPGPCTTAETIGRTKLPSPVGVRSRAELGSLVNPIVSAVVHGKTRRRTDFHGSLDIEMFEFILFSNAQIEISI